MNKTPTELKLKTLFANTAAYYSNKIVTLLAIVICSVLFLGSAKEDPLLNPSELVRLTGETWKGKLTYKDYSNNKEVTIPAELLITQSDSNGSVWYFRTSYPDEPNMNNTSIVKISDDGKEFDGETIKDKIYLSDSTLYFTTETQGEDNDRKAVIRHIHTIGNSEFKIRKEVKYDGETDYFFRNEYEFTR